MLPKEDLEYLTDHPPAILRRDFVTATHCDFCPRPIKTGIAFILQDPRGPERVAGPKCKDRWGHRLAGTIPDLTRGAREAPGTGSTDEPDTTPGRERRPPQTTEPVALSPELQRALDYVWLRVDRLPPLGFRIPDFPPIRTAYEAYRANRLSEAHLRPVAATMIKCRDTPTLRKWSYERLLACYTFAHWIDRCLKAGALRSDTVERLASIRGDLVRTFRLSPRQAELIQRCLHVAVEEPPLLDASLFD